MRDLPDIPIQGIGAVIPAQVAISVERRKLLRAQGRPEPEPIAICLLIDTGSTCSWIRSAYMDMLGLKAKSWFDVERVDSDEKVPGYEVGLILGGFGTSLAKRMDILVAGPEFKDKPHDGLLGRDVLRHLYLAWNGPTHQVKIQYP